MPSLLVPMSSMKGMVKSRYTKIGGDDRYEAWAQVFLFSKSTRQNQRKLFLFVLSFFNDFIIRHKSCMELASAGSDNLYGTFYDKTKLMLFLVKPL